MRVLLDHNIRDYPDALKQHLVDNIVENGVSPEGQLMFRDWAIIHKWVPEHDWFAEFFDDKGALLFRAAGYGDKLKTFLHPQEKPWGVRLLNVAEIYTMIEASEGDDPEEYWL